MKRKIFEKNPQIYENYNHSKERTAEYENMKKCQNERKSVVDQITSIIKGSR